MSGLGVDIVDIERMRVALIRTPHMKQRVFTDNERWYCEQKSMPEVHYALRFAAKEAIWKAVGTGFSGIKFVDVEVDHDPKGRPIAHLTGEIAACAKQRGITEIALSLSYTKSTAVASAIAITKEIAPPEDDSPLSQKEELARQFKELRVMLDEGIGAVEAKRDIEAEDLSKVDFHG